MKSYLDEMERLGVPEGSLESLRVFRKSLKEIINTHSKRNKFI